MVEGEALRARPELTKRSFTKAGLSRLGFEGWVTFTELAKAGYAQIPANCHGVYIVLRAAKTKPRFRKTSPAWAFRDNLVVPIEALRANWVDGAAVVYIGKADPRQRKPHALRQRLKEFTVFGSGGRLRHWGGRLIWQLADSNELLVAWAATPDERAEKVETWLVEEFRRCYGKPPFANNPDRLGA